ncbi:hypothetical protein RZS08_59875, partial [Arthrospira platensis SPKY1]|nr:hypothetical protein [Arthrospira platensis SPKY1]
RKPWFHPVTNQKHQSSVIDLYQKAHKISQSTIKDVFNYLNGDHSIELSQTFKNLSFDTGIDIKHDQTMKHFHLFTKK